MDGDKRYHAEVKVSIEGKEAKINCFRGTLNEIFLDIGIIAAQFPPDWKSPAKREIANAETKAQQFQDNFTPAPAVPICLNCVTAEYMELINFKDKKSGQPRQAWKCQQCNAWYWENGKK